MFSVAKDEAAILLFSYAMTDCRLRLIVPVVLNLNERWDLDRGCNEKMGCGLRYRLKDLSAVAFVSIIILAEEMSGENVLITLCILVLINRIKDSCNLTYGIPTMHTPSSQCCRQSNNTTKSDKEAPQCI